MSVLMPSMPRLSSSGVPTVVIRTAPLSRAATCSPFVTEGVEASDVLCHVFGFDGLPDAFTGLGQPVDAAFAPVFRDK